MFPMEHTQRPILAFVAVLSVFSTLTPFPLFSSSMQAVAAAAGGASLQHSAGLQHRAMQHSMMTTGAQVPAASPSSGEGVTCQ